MTSQTMTNNFPMTHEEFASLLDGDLPSIHEPVFRQYFLPMFLNQLEPDVQRQAITAWVTGVAFTPSSPVEVIDQTGRTLFIAPPLLDTKMLTVSEDSKFAEVAGLYQLNSSNQPELSKIRLNNQLMEETERSIKVTLSDQWSAMLEFYNINQQQVTSSTPQSENILDDLGL